MIYFKRKRIFYQGNTNIQFTLNTVLGEFGPPEIETCTAEIDDYLMIHNNWGNPVLDPIPGCPGVQFGSNRFNDTGNEWVCQTLKEPLVPGKMFAGHSFFTETNDNSGTTCHLNTAFSLTSSHSKPTSISCITRPYLVALDTKAALLVPNQTQ